MASDVATSEQGVSTTAQFRLSEHTKVVADDGTFVEPGSAKIGMVARRGHMPIGYYKDDAKTAATFRMIGGERFSIPGDFARVNADGTLSLLGRGSVCINTGGEKVFPEEVEEVLKVHPDVLDAIVVGLPDDRFGEMVVAVVEPSSVGVDETVLIDHVKAHLARYKAPKRVMLVDSIGRAANGKLDYSRWQRFASDESDPQPAPLTSARDQAR